MAKEQEPRLIDFTHHYSNNGNPAEVHVKFSTEKTEEGFYRIEMISGATLAAMNFQSWLNTYFHRQQFNEILENHLKTVKK